MIANVRDIKGAYLGRKTIDFVIFRADRGENSSTTATYVFFSSKRRSLASTSN
jgi:hypothetical protein